MNFFALVGSLNPGTFASVFKVGGGAAPLTAVTSSTAFNLAPAYMALNLNGTLAYVANEASGTNAGVTSVAITWPPPNLSPQVQPTFTTLSFIATDEPCAISLHPSLRYVMSASYQTGSITVMPIDSVTGAAGTPVLPVQILGSHAHEIIFAGGGRDVYVPLLGSDSIAILTFDAETGILTPNAVTPYINVTKGYGPRHLALHPTLPSRVYLMCELSNVIVSLIRDVNTGALSLAPASEMPLSTLRTNRPQATVQAGADVIVSPDGRFLYASNRAKPYGAGDNSVAIFTIDSQGILSPPFEWCDDGVNFPRNMNFSPDAEASLLLIANQAGASVSAYARDLITGSLIQIDSIDSSPQITLPSFIYLKEAI